MQTHIPRLVIAAPSSGSGKSTIASGLMAALARQVRVQGFKVGPDYIDPGYHSAATGRPARNLDSWMVSHDEVSAIFGRGVQDADIAIIEGVMGLYDGFDALTERGSTAQVAKLLGAPVVLVIDVGKMARSAGAIALGYRDFDPALQVAGVICNNVASDKHALWVTQAVESTGLPVLGCVRRNADLRVPERHLGLQTAVERAETVQDFLDKAADAVSSSIDMDRLWTLARSAPALSLPADSQAEPVPVRARIAVAYDAAFCFYYADNFDWLRAAGAELVFFSPLHDEALPADIDGLYLGGGYPELYAPQLARNAAMLGAIGQAVRAGLPTYAECGGLMVLTESMTGLDGQTYPMVGVVPGRAQMAQRLYLGYREVTASRDTLLLPAGAQTRGHEFHYSDWLDRPDDLSAAYAVAPRLSESVRQEGYAQGNLLASYVHLHFGSNPGMAQRFVDRCAG